MTMPDAKDAIQYIQDNLPLFATQGSVQRDGGRLRLRWREKTPDGRLLHRSIALPDTETAALIEEAFTVYREALARKREAEARRRLDHRWLRGVLRVIPSRLQRERLWTRWSPVLTHPGRRDILAALDLTQEPALRQGRRPFEFRPSAPAYDIFNAPTIWDDAYDLSV